MALKQIPEQIEKPKKSKEALTLFLMLFPSLLIAGNYGDSVIINAGIKAAIIFYQFVVIKAVLDDYYKYQ